jgi:hypothetical protein
MGLIPSAIIYSNLIHMEYRVYCIDPENDDMFNEDGSRLTNEQFMDAAEKRGLVWSLEGFQDAFNLNRVSDTWVMRIIKHS